MSNSLGNILKVYASRFLRPSRCLVTTSRWSSAWYTKKGNEHDQSEPGREGDQSEPGREGDQSEKNTQDEYELNPSERAANRITTPTYPSNLSHEDQSDNSSRKSSSSGNRGRSEGPGPDLLEFEYKGRLWENHRKAETFDSRDTQWDNSRKGERFDSRDTQWDNRRQTQGFGSRDRSSDNRRQTERFGSRDRPWENHRQTEYKSRQWDNYRKPEKYRRSESDREYNYGLPGLGKRPPKGR